MKEFKGTKWTRGKLLKTRITSQWDHESFEKTNCYERARVFSNFSEEDQGRSRVLVCTLNESHPDYELNSSIITTAPELLEALQELVLQVKTYSKGYSDTTEYFKSEIEQAEKVINKALGL